MSLCYLYDDTISSIHAQGILDECEKSVSYNINNLVSIENFDIYIIELHALDREKSLKLKQMFESKNHVHIYFTNFKEYSLILIQLIILLEVKDFITETQDTKKVIEKIRINIKAKQDKDIQKPNLQSTISHRLTFVELIKDKLISNTTLNNNLSIMSIGMQDEKRLQKNISRSKVELFLSGLLSYMDITLEKKLIFAQYDRDFYIALFENINFDEIKKIAYDFYLKSTKYISKKDFKLLLDIFIFNLDGLEFCDILNSLEDIQYNIIDKDKTQSYIQRIGNQNTDIDEYSVLKDAFKNKLEFKLLNIYQGLCIHTSSHIIKMSDSSIYINFEQLQGVIINIDKFTIMQSSAFLKDIQADVKYIDQKKKIALLDNFKFLDTNANSRKYSRVTPYSRMPIAIFLDGGSLIGDILDISIKSVAIKAKYSTRVQTMKGRDVKVVFNIPSKEEIGYSKLTLDAIVVFSTQADSDGLCKIVCDFLEDGMSESLLMEYVYDRQKKLIVELKKMVQLQ